MWPYKSNNIYIHMKIFKKIKYISLKKFKKKFFKNFNYIFLMQADFKQNYNYIHMESFQIYLLLINHDNSFILSNQLVMWSCGNIGTCFNEELSPHEDLNSCGILEVRNVVLVLASRRVKWKVRGNDLISRLRKNMDRKIGTFICLSKRHLTLRLTTTTHNLFDSGLFFGFVQ